MEAKELIYDIRLNVMANNAHVYTHVFVLQILTQNESENRETIGGKSLDYMAD